MRQEIIGRQFDAERSLYHLQKTDVLDCIFAGPADGESVLKEARDVKLENCTFSLRYPLWHVDKFHLHDSKMDELTRAPIWYSKNGLITDSDIHGIKAVRECENIQIRDCTITSEDAECKDPHDIICFMTYLYTKGFVIKKNKNNIHFLIHNENYFSYEIQLTEKQTDHVFNDNHINGDMLKKVIKDEIETAGITNTILNTKFTDIAISYLNGIHGEILGSVVVNNMESPNNQYSIVPFTDDYCVFRSLLEKKENSDKKEFAYIYIWSIIRKAKYKHL